MPSDLIIDVRQVSSYPPITQSNGTETVLVQQGGLGGPYASISTEALVSTALNSASLGVGTPVPSGASAGNVFANPVVLPLPQASILWNAYDAGGLRYVAAGMMAALNFDQAKGFDFVLAPVGNPNAAVIGDQPIMQLTNAGNLNLPFGTLAVARDPSATNEVVTLSYLGNNTVHSFNNRNGQVQLNADDVYAALRLCDPIATQPWVQNAINQSIQNLLVTCPFVNRWNNRTGSVYLMLSDITTVFYQPGQQPISPTPPITSNDDSIATTKWIKQYYAPAPTQTTPPVNPTSGQLWWNDVDGNLYVYYTDPTSAQWVSAMADGGSSGGGIAEPAAGGPYGRITGAWEPVLPLTGGTIQPPNMTATVFDAALFITATARGSGVNGPQTAQIGLNINHQKTDYLTTTQVGEIDGLYVTVRQGGPGSDVGGILVDVANTGNGFSAILEAVNTQMAPTTGATQRAIRVQTGGINPPANAYTGILLQAQDATSTQAILINDEPGRGEWTNFIEGWHAGSQNFVVNSAGNVSASGGFSSASGQLLVQASASTAAPGSYFQWNHGGDGSTWIVNQMGAGSTGGVILGSSDAAGVITALFAAVPGSIYFQPGMSIIFDTTSPIFLPSDLVDAANDAAAGAAGVGVRQMYRNGSQLMMRVT